MGYLLEVLVNKHEAGYVNGLVALCSMLCIDCVRYRRRNALKENGLSLGDRNVECVI